MDIFLSYRRSDNNILAGTVAELLRSGVEGARVFFDQQGIQSGRNYRAVIDQEIEKCQVLIALIGPGWEEDGRLHNADDFVRHELLRARALNKHIVPVLHSGRSMPSPAGLPDELEWLHLLNAATVGTRHAEFVADVADLCVRVRSIQPELRELRDRVWHYYETRQDAEALRLAGEAWEAYRHQPSPGLADCCRGAALILTRQGRLIERELWRARTITTGVLGGGRNAIAFSLLPSFFQLAKGGFHHEARSLLEEMRRLIEEDPGQLPPPNVLRRVYSEKLAWSLNETGDFEEAVAMYDQAILAAPEDLRGVTKARGGQANSRFKLGDIAGAIATTEDVLAKCLENDWDDLAIAAEANLRIMYGEEGPFEPYEVV